jgi:hypothetical protein
MNSFGIVLTLGGIWVIVNGINGNLSGLVSHEVTFTLPANTSAAIADSEPETSDTDAAQGATGPQGTAPHTLDGLS